MAPGGRPSSGLCRSTFTWGARRGNKNPLRLAALDTSPAGAGEAAVDGEWVWLIIGGHYCAALPRVVAPCERLDGHSGWSFKTLSDPLRRTTFPRPPEADLRPAGKAI